MPPETPQPDWTRLEEAIVALAAELGVRMAHWLDLVAVFDRHEGARHWGFRSTAEWLAWRCGIDLRTARDHVRVARRLAVWTGVRAAVGSGEISYAKARALARADECEDERALLDRARACSAAQLEREVRALRTAPSADVDVANEVHARRYLAWEWEEDGGLRIHGRLGADEGAALVEALEAAAEALHPAPPQEREDVVPARPALGARRADALTEIVYSGAPRAQVVLHVDETALQCTAHGDQERAGTVCALEDGPAVPSATARRLACDGEVVTGHGRKRRVVSPALRTSLERRDRRCRFPDCGRRHGLHAHHIAHWAHGGATDPENLVMVCRFHHRLVHEEDFTVEWESGAIVFRRPDGEVIPERGPPLAVAA